MKSRLNSLYKNIYFDVINHIETSQYNILNIESNKNIFTICCIGAISKEKGADILIKMSNYINKHKLSARIVLIGYGDGVKPNESLIVTGKYTSEDELFKHIITYKPSIFFHSSIWPETFAYTLSAMLRVNLPIAAFDIGAQAERLRKFGMNDNLIPLAYKDDIKKLYDILYKISNLNNFQHRPYINHFESSFFDLYYSV